MTFVEWGLILAGSALVIRFFLIALVPCANRYLNSTAETRARELKEEFLPLSTRMILCILTFSGITISAIVFRLTSNITLGAVSIPLPFLFSRLAVGYYRRKRRKRIISQLPGFLDVLSGHIKAGHSFQESLSDSIPLLPEEIRKEISWIFRLIRLGTPITDALTSWEERIPCEEIILVVRPLVVALPAGGNLVELLHQSRDILRLRKRMEEKTRAMTAQARLQAVILTLLPPAFVGFLSKVDPSYFPLCIGTIQGKAILVTSGILLLLGWATIKFILSAKP